MAEQIYNKLLLCLLYFIVFYCNTCRADNACVQESPCLCRFENNKKIDISPVITSGYFLNATIDNLTYYFHPCKDALLDYSHLVVNNSTLNGCNKPLSLCLYNATSQSLTTLGDVKDAKFFKDDPYSLLYTTGANETIGTIVTLACTLLKESYLFALPKSVQNRLILFSPHACEAGEPHSLSTGAVLLILFAVGGCIYLVGGALVLHFLRGARGKEMIPNIDFWSSLPGLVRDGLLFLLSGCTTSSVATAETYDRI